MLLLTRLSADQKGQTQLGLFKELNSGSSMGFVAFKYQHLPIGMDILCPSAPPVKEQGWLGAGSILPRAFF